MYEGIIGRGSFAVVHKGRWQEKAVALKCIRIPFLSNTSEIPKEVEILRYMYIRLEVCQLKAEKLFYRKLQHPNIITLLGYSFSDDEIILITNYVKGCNLDKMLFGKTTRVQVSMRPCACSLTHE